MSSLDNTVFAAARPIQLLTKIFGLCSQKDLCKMGNKADKFNLIGTIHVVTILSLKVFLIYFNLDPSKFSNATNSTILNHGLWIQTEVSLVISTFYMLIGIRKNSQMWTLLQNFHDIDQEFSKSFFLKYYYVQGKHWISLFVVSGVVIHFVLISITTYYIWNLPFEFWHKISILVAIYFANICIYSIANQYLYSLLYLSSRFQNLNDILSQLIFDEPISTRILIVGNGMALGEGDGRFVKSMASHTQRKRVVQKVFERTEKSGITFIDTFDNNSTQMRYPFDKEFPQTITSIRDANAGSVQSKKAKFTPLSVVAYKTTITKLAFTRSSTVADKLNKLDKLMELYDRLCDCVDLCNYLLSLQIVLMSLTICVYIVFGLFAKYRVWMDYQYEASNVSQMNIYWIVVYTFWILIGTYVSTMVTQTIEETAVIIHKVACRNENSVILNKLSRISQMLYSRKITVGLSCGLILFDWPTVFTLFGSVCMYLIILIQFYISGRSNKIQQPNQNNETSFA